VTRRTPGDPTALTQPPRAGYCRRALTLGPKYWRLGNGAYTPKHLAERIINSKAAVEGERKQVTVLFADLKGSMELLADRDPVAYASGPDHLNLRVEGMPRYTRAPLVDGVKEER
jgi:class 3 adenylate cyclase